MSELLLSTLSKVLIPAAAIGLMLFVAKKRGIAWDTGIGLQRPRTDRAIYFLVGWIVLVIVEEYISRMTGEFTAKPWPAFPMLIIVLRILAIGMLGPIAEELAFRGLLFSQLSRTRIGPYGAILICAVLWALIHFDSTPVAMMFIVVDGIFLGLARHLTGSLWVPIAMHVGGNLFSIYQSLAQ